MDMPLIPLRALHIIFGTFWVGTDVFVTFLLMPRLHSLGRNVERPVIAALMRVLPPALMVSSVVSIVSGLWLVGLMRGWDLGWVLTTGWGGAMLLGFVATVLALVVGFGLIPPLTMRMDKIDRGIEGRGPTADEDRQLQLLTSRITTLARSNSILLIIVVIAMAVARFV